MKKSPILNSNQVQFFNANVVINLWCTRSFDLKNLAAQSVKKILDCMKKIIQIILLKNKLYINSSVRNNTTQCTRARTYNIIFKYGSVHFVIQNVYSQTYCCKILYTKLLLIIMWSLHTHAKMTEKKTIILIH